MTNTWYAQLRNPCWYDGAVYLNLNFSVKISQGAGRAEVHYLPNREVISFYVYIVTFRPNKYISVCWTCSNFLWALANTFFKTFLQNYIVVKKGKFQIHLYKKPPYQEICAILEVSPFWSSNNSKTARKTRVTVIKSYMYFYEVIF